MWPDRLGIDVAPDALEKLRIYYALLLKWQPVINLVAPSTVSDAAVRHFADSAQVARYVDPGVRVMADLGSGAGFPGMVLAIMRPEIEMHLIESDERKAEFLRTVSRETSAPVKVHADRLVRVIDHIRPGWVSARALADLRKLLIYTEPWSQSVPGFTALFMKGVRAEEEIAEAQKSFSFDCEAFPSVTEPSARILRLRHIAAKKVHKRR